MEKIITIEKLDHQGRGIGFINNKIIFIDKALVNEKIKVEITLDKKKFYEGKILEIIKKSEDRINSKCPYFKECGGCDLLHISYKKQLEFKQTKVLEILKKYSKIENIDTKIKPIIDSEQIFNYRNKVTFQVHKKIGFYKRKSNELVEVENCLLISSSMNEILDNIIKKIDLNMVDQIVIKDMGECQLMLSVYLQKPLSSYEVIENLSKKIESINIYIKDKLYKTIGKSNIIAKIQEFEFLISPSSFFQINTSQTVKLYDQVLNYCSLKKEDTVLDLYCGTGTIGIYLSHFCNKVIGVEINKDAINDANKNKQLNKISNIEFMVGDTKDIIKKIEFKPSVIIVDPPRSGLEKSVIEDIFKIKPNKIIYVSCDPITLARDLGLLNSEYEIIELTPIDMFPNTAHVECVVLLKQKNIMQ